MNTTNYLASLSDFNLLTAEREHEIFTRVQDGDRDARDKAITANLRLVVNIAKRYSHAKVSFADLVQAGNVGLVTAVDKFDPKRKKRFSTYATFWIKQAILKFLNDHKNIVRYPSYIVDYISKISKFVKKYKEDNRNSPEAEDVATHLGVSKEEVYKLLDLMSTSYISLEDQIANGTPICSDEESTEYNMCERFRSDKIVEMVDSLRTKEREVMIHRFGLFGNEKETLEIVAKKLDITRERVRQIQNSVLAKLRERAMRI